jgi:hypothetical protein
LNIVHKESEEDIDVLDDKGTPIIKVEVIEDDVRNLYHTFFIDALNN